jgi:SAP domain
MNDIASQVPSHVAASGVNPKELSEIDAAGMLPSSMIANSASPFDVFSGAGLSGQQLDADLTGSVFDDPSNAATYGFMAIPNSGNAATLKLNYSGAEQHHNGYATVPTMQSMGAGALPMNNMLSMNPLAGVPYLNQAGSEFMGGSHPSDYSLWAHQQQQHQLGAMVNPMHLTYHSGYPMMGAGGPTFVTNNSMMTAKVPMLPWRGVSAGSGFSEEKPLAPLLLPFHHKNDNSIIPQTFGAGMGHHSLGTTTMMSHYSIEELQRSKDLFITKANMIDFSNITVVELKNFLKDFGLAPGGKKEDLIARIKQIKDYLINEQKGLTSSSTAAAAENPFIIYGSNSYFPSNSLI